MMASPRRSHTPDTSLVLPPFQPPPSSSSRHHTSPTHPRSQRPLSSSIMPASASLSTSTSRLPPLTGHDLMDAFPNPPPPVPDEYGRARFNQSERAFLSSRAGERTRDQASTTTSTSTSSTTRGRSGSDAGAAAGAAAAAAAAAASGAPPSSRSFIRLPPLVKSGEPPREPSIGRLRASPFAPAYLASQLPPPSQPPFTRSQTPQPYHNNYGHSSWSRDPSDPTQLHHPYTHHHHHHHHHYPHSPPSAGAAAAPGSGTTPTAAAPYHRPSHHHSRSASGRSSFESTSLYTSTGALRNPPPPTSPTPAPAGSGSPAPPPPQYARSHAMNSPPVSRPTTSTTAGTPLGLPLGTVLPKPPSTVGTARPPSASNTSTSNTGASPAMMPRTHSSGGPVMAGAVGPVRTAKRQRAGTRGSGSNEDETNRALNTFS